MITLCSPGETRDVPLSTLAAETIKIIPNLDPDSRFLVDIRLYDQRHEGTSRLFETGHFDRMEVANA